MDDLFLYSNTVPDGIKLVKMPKNIAKKDFIEQEPAKMCGYILEKEYRSNKSRMDIWFMRRDLNFDTFVKTDIFPVEREGDKKKYKIDINIKPLAKIKLLVKSGGVKPDEEFYYYGSSFYGVIISGPVEKYDQLKNKTINFCSDDIEEDTFLSNIHNLEPNDYELIEIYDEKLFDIYNNRNQLGNEDVKLNGGNKKSRKSSFKSKTNTKSRKSKNQKGGKKYEIMQCSQEIVNLPRMDCLKKNCTGTKKYKDNVKKLSKLNYQHDKFVAKTCNLKFNKSGVYVETDEDYKCNREQRKGKLFESILKLEDETSTSKCEEKHCAKVNYMDDCIDLGEEQCRIKYKDLIENIEKTKKKKILPLSDCMGND
jgi:hypothetical protein